MIAIYVTLWLLCGVLGAYIGHRFVDDRFHDTSLREVLVMAALGPIALLAAVVALVCVKIEYSALLDKAVFKSKY